MNLSQLFTTIFAAVKSGLITMLVPELLTFFQNTQSLDLLSVAGLAQYVAQLDLLRSSVGAGLTKLAPTDLQSIIQTFDNEIEAALTELVTKAKATSSSAATPAAPAAA